MFWACEEKSAPFWRDDFLVQSIRELLNEMMKWLKVKFCANYFIPGNNMMDHLIDTDLSPDINNMWKALESVQLIREVIYTCWRNDLLSASQICHIESPAWIKRAFLIHDCLENKDYLKIAFKVNLRIDIVNALYVELSDIYMGLLFQQKSVTSFNISKKYTDLLKLQFHLTSAVNLFESHVRDVLDNCSEKFIASIASWFMPCDTDVSSGKSSDNIELNTNPRSSGDIQNSVNGRKEQKCLLYSRLMQRGENNQTVTSHAKDDQIKRKINLSLFLYIKTNVEGVTRSSYVNCVKECPGWSPTVNISWFIAKAYLANLYYTTQCDVSLTMQTCDDVIDVFRQSVMNKKFAERTFPVVLSTQWTSIYDKEIQELLGFYSLCSYVLDKCSSRSVYLGVCPVQFAHYLKLRTKLSHGLRGYIMYRYTDDFNQHFKTCRFDAKVIGILTLQKAYNIGSKRYR